MSNIELVVESTPKDLGDNFIVRRSLPHRSKRMVGPFIFWDHMGPVTLENDKEMVVRSHPHIGLATITWLFSGEILHRDNLGNEQTIKPGEVNWMTAGSGIAHSERASSKNSPMNLEGIQLWLALPKEHEEVKASFFHCKNNDLPVLVENDFELTLIAGRALGLKSPVPVYSNLFYLSGNFFKDASFDMNLEENQEGAIYVVSGEIEVEGQKYDQYSLIIFKKESRISFKSLTTNSSIMIFGGDIFPEPRFIWWNFVSTDKDKIEKAKVDWKEGRFPIVINESDYIPLPKY